MLSLAMIVKDEAQTIERTIQSVREHVDEVVVGLDTESSDGTEEIVRRLADTVVDIHLTEELKKKGPLNGDGRGDWGFSSARNRVLDACDPDNWRLVLDGHETVCNPEEMALAISEANAIGFDGIESMLHFEPKESGGVPQTMFATSRLLAPTVKYSNPIHNVPVIERTHCAHSIIVEHLKRDQSAESRVERDKQRSDANIEGLRNKLRIKSDDARSWYYLATAYRENGRYHEAVEAFEECLRYSVWNEERWHARFNSGVCHNCLGETEKAREQFVLALEEFPVMAEAYYCLADLAYKQQRFYEAEVWLTKCVQLKIPNCRLFINPRVYLVDRYDLFSMVYDHLGQYVKAIEQAEKALEAEDNSRIEKNIRIWKEHING